MEEKKPKLLVLTTTFPRWKNDTDPPFVYELSKRLTSSFDVIVHTPHFHGALVDEQMDGIHVHRFRYFFSRFERLAGGQGIVPKLRRNKLYYFLLPFFLISQLFSLVVLVVKIRPEAIHAHWLIPQGLWAIFIKKIFKIPVIITAHGADVYGLRIPLIIRINKWVVKNADRIVPVSLALADILVHDTHSRQPMDVISMGVDGTLFSPQKQSEYVRQKYNISGLFLLFVGRLSEKKGVSYLIDAMPLVIRKIPDAKLLIIGHGELEQELRAQVLLNDLTNFVLFAGAMTNAELPPYYATADIFIGPSVQVNKGDTEGLPVTCVEATMSGCLVIGTKVGGVEEVIQDGQTGYIVPPEDSQALAKTILSVFQQKESLAEMKLRGRKRALENFEWGVVAHRYEGLLRYVIATNIA